MLEIIAAGPETCLLSTCRGLKPPLYIGVSAVGKSGIAAGGDKGGHSIPFVPLCAAFLEK